MTIGQTLVAIDKIGKHSSEGMAVFDLSNNSIEYSNPALIKIFGSTLPDSVEGLSQYIFGDDVHYINTSLKKLHKNQAVSNIEFRIHSQDAIRWLSCDAYLLKDENKILVVAKDITRLKEHEDYIITYGGKKDALLEMLSHNLTGPLNLSQQVTAMLEKSYQKEKASDLTSHINFIKEATKQCIDIIHDFLKDEHLTSERIFVKKNRFDVVEVIHAVLDQFNHSYPGRHLKLQSECDRLFVNGDDVKFLQIVTNLLSNAIKFTPKNCAVNVTLKEDSDTYTFIVQDEGIGIPEHLKPLIFKRNTPAGRTGLNGEKSLGLGLSIIKKLAELMKGEIYFESEENHGSTFFVTLPKE